MTTYSTISNPSVAVGAIPSSTVVTALRDNPIAMAEASSGAPINVCGWHPVDKVTVGDGKRGVIYDSALNGAVASVVTSDFADGFEYKLVAHDIDGVALGSFQIDLYGQTDAAYTNSLSIAGGSSADIFGVEMDILLPRITKTHHSGPAYSYRSSSFNTVTYYNAYFSTAQKVLRARVRVTNGNIQGGKVWLFRRREFASAD